MSFNFLSSVLNFTINCFQDIFLTNCLLWDFLLSDDENDDDENDDNENDDNENDDDELDNDDSELLDNHNLLFNLLRSAMTDLFLAAYCDSSEFSLNSVKLVSSSSL